MKLDYAPQTGLRRARPDRRRERLAFWAGIAIVAAFEVVLMAKTWPPIDWPWGDGRPTEAQMANAEYPGALPPAPN